ncbi:MAG TPA: hypothetical protein VN698_15690, partial [Bacteroidia bacterium]|nr:hypothetical protein [Bacteroidia bacterium]
VLTLSAGMTITSSSIVFNLNGAATTITTNGFIVSYLACSVTGTYTLADNLNVGTLSLAVGGLTYTFNGNTINIGTSFTGQNSITCAGTSNIVFNGVNASYNCVGLFLKNNLTIAVSGTLTMSNSLTIVQGTFAYTSGTVVTSALSFGCATTGGGCTLNLGSAVKFPSLGLNGSITLTNDLWTTGNCTFGSSANCTFSGVYTIYVGGNVTDAGNSIVGPSGQASIIMNGTGTLSCSGVATTSNINSNIIINTTGTVTIGNLNRSTGTFQYIAGTVTVTPGTAFTINNTGTVLDVSAITFNNININNAPVITLNSALNATGTMSYSSNNLTFAGSFGWTVGSFVMTTLAGAQMVLQAGNTYVVNNNINVTGTSASHNKIISSSGSVRAILTINRSASQTIKYCDGTWIDSSGGRQVRTYKGTISNTINWTNHITDLNTFN